MHLREALMSLDQIYSQLFSPKWAGKSDADQFAQSWYGARQFRDQSLLLLARYASNALISKSLDIDSVAMRLSDFTMKFLTNRQIAFTYDLTMSLINHDHQLKTEFHNATIAYISMAHANAAEKIESVTSGISGYYFFDPRKLSTLHRPETTDHPGVVGDLENSPSLQSDDLLPFEDPLKRPGMQWLSKLAKKSDSENDYLK